MKPSILCKASIAPLERKLYEELGVNQDRLGTSHTLSKTAALIRR